MGLALCACLLASVSGVRADNDEYDQLESHPLRLVAYLIHPLGYALEWLVARPIHYLVSRPGLEDVFGHRGDHADQR